MSTMVDIATRSRRAETIQGKAVRLIASGCLWIERIDPDLGITALVRGDSGVRWVVTYEAGAWSCTCPAFVRRCSHVRAVALVTERTPS